MSTAESILTIFVVIGCYLAYLKLKIESEDKKDACK